MTYEQTIELIAFVIGIIYGSVNITYIIIKIVQSTKK